jgi:hypothetical protein
MTDAAPTLDELKGQNRVLLAFAPGGDDDPLKRQLEAFREGEPALKERDVVVFVLPAEGSASCEGAPVGAEQVGALRDRFDAPEDQLTVVLVGKDGGEKKRWTGYAPIPEIDDTIDAMPMRRREMETRREEAP